MNGYIALTDHDWFQFLREKNFDEINFWKPGGQAAFHPIDELKPFIFILKKRYGNKICGFGFFASYSTLPLWLAWESFGEKNGAKNLSELNSLVSQYKQKSDVLNENIGCIMVAQPIFFNDDEFIDGPNSWSQNIVSGKTYDLVKDVEGKRIWEECLVRTRSRRIQITTPIDLDAPRYAEAVLIKPRLGQGIFRVSVTEAYERACAVSTEHSLPVLQAAHIIPYAENGSHEVSNGILLRSDIHRLFDLGYVTISPDHKFEVSPRLKAQYNNGRVYYDFHGKSIFLPKNTEKRPNPDHLSWHRENIFLQ